jgi:hypothetical protein
VSWTVEEPAASITYRRHMTSEQKVAVASPRTGRVRMEWRKVGGAKSENHLWDTEVEQVAAAWNLGLLKTEAMPV